MNQINHILVCCDQYPTKLDPVFPFVEQLVNAFAQKGMNMSVVAPQSLTKHFLRKTPLHPIYRKIERKGNGVIEIYQPYTITLGLRFAFVNRFCLSIVLWLTLRNIKAKPDVCYGHFWHCSLALFKYAKKNKIPLFVSSGEASIEKETPYSFDEMNDFLNYYKGAFFVSTKNKLESKKLGFLKKQKNIVVPNAFDASLFYQKNKSELREKYNIPKNCFVVIFVGGFIERKGPNRVAAALKILNNRDIKAIFVGREHDGVKFDFEYGGTILKGVVEHEKLVDYLNVADVFVLPTLAEGCCNALIEAMACGLPIISSNLPFNDDVLDDECSIRINPNSVDDIANAIQLLYENVELRNRMCKAALDKVASLTIENRANKIIDFMNVCLGGGHHANMV